MFLFRTFFFLNELFSCKIQIFHFTVPLSQYNFIYNFLAVLFDKVLYNVGSVNQFLAFCNTEN